MDIEAVVYEADERSHRLLSERLRKHGVRSRKVRSLNSLKKKIKPGLTGMVLINPMLEKQRIRTLIQSLKELDPTLEIILLCDGQRWKTIAQGLHSGAAGYFSYPIDDSLFQSTIRRILAVRNVNGNTLPYNPVLPAGLLTMTETECPLLSEDPVYLEVLDHAINVAKDPGRHVLLIGERGTCKGVLGGLIHHTSPRSSKPFAGLNCAVLPADRLKHELFGYCPPSLGHHEICKGLLELNNGGGLFLSRIGELSSSLSEILCRTLTSGELKSGQESSVPIDIRVIAAQDDGEVFPTPLRKIDWERIEIPPLRQRKRDIRSLFEFFIEYFSRKFNVTVPSPKSAVYDLLNAYDYPGNVLELRNITERAILLSGGNRLSTDHFPIFSPESTSSETGSHLNLDAMEKRMILSALRHARGNQSEAADMLGISRFALIRRMKKYRISTDFR